MWGTSDMSDRYAHNWAKRSRDTKRSRQHGDTVQCSCCGGYYDWDEVEVHHTSYQGENDRAGVNIFPICGSKQDPGTCHHWVHQQGNWITDKWDPTWGNHNSRSVVKRLQRGYRTGNPEGLDFEIPWALISAIGAMAIGWIIMSALFNGKPQQRTAIVTSPVNVRSAPSQSAVKLGTLPKGRSVKVWEVKDGWFRIDNGQWIAGNFVKERGLKR
jgi:hypothetical protein